MHHDIDSLTRELFVQSLRRDPAERAAFLDEACSDDPALKGEVAALLQSYEEDPDFMDDFDRPAVIAGADHFGPSTVELTVEPGLPYERFGEFRLLRRLGEGGMGVVFLAWQESLGREVALKVIRPEKRDSLGAETRFWREIEAASKINHPNIATIFASGEENGVHYFAMELVTGESLNDKLHQARARQERIPLEKVLRWIHEISQALDCAHCAGIIHRDVKPANIQITAEGKAVLMDFGLARHLDRTTITLPGQMHGTPHYASPEQVWAHNRRIDERTDIYSLGVTLYEAVTGRVPFEGDTTEQVLQQVREADPVPPRRLNPAISRGLDTVILKALEKDPGRRYLKMASFTRDVERLIEGIEPLVKPAGWGSRLAKAARKNPSLSVAIGIILILVVAVPWVFVSQEKSKRKLAEEAAFEIEQERNNANLEKLRAQAAEQEEKLQRTEAQAARAKAEEAQKEAEESATLANELLVEIQHLTGPYDLMRLAELELQADDLWPARPERAREMQAWLAEAEELAGNLELHRSNLDELRLTYTTLDEGWEDLKAERRDLVARLEALKAEKTEGRATGTAAGQSVIQQLEEELVSHDAVLARTGDKITKRGAWLFVNPAAQREHDRLTTLIAKIEDLSADDFGPMAQMQQRLDFAGKILPQTLAAHREDWEEAIATIAESKEYFLDKGLTITPMQGLVPIGRDPHSGLFEFGHLESGSIAQRDDLGEPIINVETGIVFVLIPGGTFSMGAVKPSNELSEDDPNVDPYAEPDEGPVHEVTVAPFLLSKFELTQAQWLRLTGSNPSFYYPGKEYCDKVINPLHPVEQVNWQESVRMLRRYEMRLPTEAEWEYAARAHTDTIWWMGNDQHDLDGVANLADETLGTLRIPFFKIDEWMNDGYACHAPIGSYLPNPFGLKDLYGNVGEWCQDAYEINYSSAPRDGSAFESGDNLLRIVRGGTWSTDSTSCRSALRIGEFRSNRNANVGLRPAISLERK